MEMTSKILSKKEAQKMITALKEAKLPIKKTDFGYILEDKNGNLFFKAMIGNNGYLVRYAKKLFN